MIEQQQQTETAAVEDFPPWIAIPELKSCPYCGHYACFTETIHGEHWGQWDYRIWCSSSHCRAEIRLPALSGNKARLMAKWNQRYQAAAQ